jgi:hypothetical protein
MQNGFVSVERVYGLIGRGNGSLDMDYRVTGSAEGVFV